MCLKSDQANTVPHRPNLLLYPVWGSGYRQKALRSEFDTTLIVVTLQINLAALLLLHLQKNALLSALHRHNFNCCNLRHGQQQKVESTGKGASGPFNSRKPFCWYLPAMKDIYVKGESSWRSY
jgi:hypothetical protein